jgi:hypothetical protein
MIALLRHFVVDPRFAAPSAGEMRAEYRGESFHSQQSLYVKRSVWRNQFNITPYARIGFFIKERWKGVLILAPESAIESFRLRTNDHEELLDLRILAFHR